MAASQINQNTVVNQVATSSDYRFHVMRSDQGVASISLEQLVSNQGVNTWQVVSDTTGAISQANAGWDDSIPWASGTYDLRYAGAFAGANDSWRVDDADTGTRHVANRDGIRLHQGNQANPSQALEGCIGATASFLSRAHSALVQASQGTSLTRIPMLVDQDNFFRFRLERQLAEIH